MADWTDLTYAVVDVEGNGQQPPDLVELAVVPVTGGVIGKPTSWLVCPEQPIRHFATRIHGLTNRDVADAPPFAAIRGDVLSVLKGSAIVAHNAHVDVGVLSRELGDWEPPEAFDTLKLARRFLPGQESYRLGALADVFKLAEELPNGLVPHRASYDAVVTARLFVRLALLSAARPLSLDELRGNRHGGCDDGTPALF